MADQPTGNKLDGGIAVAQLSRDFGGLRAVDAVDLDVPSGRIFAFLGPNGAGKSTLVKMLVTILKPSAGTATVAGYDVTRQGAEVRAVIGVALQEVGLDPLMTASEMLTLQARLFGASATGASEKAARLLATVGLADVDAKKRVGAYSGGMKRRLDLALALVNEPRILFLDEPTTGLDPVSRMAIWEEVRRLNDDLGMTIFLTTQYLEEADRLADDVAIINRGRIVARGSPAELKRTVGDEVIELEFGEVDQAARADAVLAPLAAQRNQAGRELRLYVPRAAEVVPDLVRRLDAAGLAPTGLTLAQATLDDVFLRATGETMKAAEGDGDGALPDEAGAAEDMTAPHETQP